MTNDELKALAEKHLGVLTQGLLDKNQFNYTHEDITSTYLEGFLHAVTLLDRHCRAREETDCDGRSGGRDDMLGAAFNSGLSAAQEPFDELLYYIAANPSV